MRRRSAADDWKADQERDAPWAARLLELAAQRGDPLTALTPNTVVPVSLAREWFMGMRPLPGQDENFFFSAVAEMVGPRVATEWRQRHARLRAEEMGVAARLDVPQALAEELIRHGWRPPAPAPISMPGDSA